MRSIWRKWRTLPLAAGLVLALDQLAKWLTVTNLELGESWQVIPGISSFIRVTRSYNTGAAFGIFPAGSDLFLIVALVTAGVFIYMFPRMPEDARLSKVGISLIIGGALSNAIDRLRFEHVVDYVHVQLTPTFANISNFADHAITLGVILLLIDQWLQERRQQGKPVDDPDGALPEPEYAAPDASETVEGGAQAQEAVTTGIDNPAD